MHDFAQEEYDLSTALRAADPEQRMEALRTLGARPDDSLLLVVSDLLVDEVPAVRHLAAEVASYFLSRSLGQQETPEVPDSFGRRVLDGVRDEYHMVRRECAILLALLPESASPSIEERASALEVLLADAELKVRREAAAAATDLGQASLANVLSQAARDPDPDLRFEAAFALATLKDDRARPVLEASLKGRRFFDACEGFRRLGHRDAVPVLQRVAGRFFMGWPERLTLWATLYALGQPDASAQILKRGRSRNRAERAYALGLLGTHRILEGCSLLVGVAQDTRDPLRDIAVRALGEMGDGAGLEPLLTIARSEGCAEALRVDAIHAIRRLPGAKQALKEFKKNENRVLSDAALG